MNTYHGGLDGFYFASRVPNLHKNQSITLHKGWNMVGYLSLSSYNRTGRLNNLAFDADMDLIWTYNTTMQRGEEMGPADYFELGRGYWLHLKVEKIWEVPI